VFLASPSGRLIHTGKVVYLYTLELSAPNIESPEVWTLPTSKIFLPVVGKNQTLWLPSSIGFMKQKKRWTKDKQSTKPRAW